MPSFSGTTMVLTEISSLIQKYVSVATQLLLKISDDLCLITRISHSIAILDKNVAIDATILNDDVTMQLASKN